MCTYIYAGRSGNENNIRGGKTPNFLALDVEEEGGRILWSRHVPSSSTSSSPERKKKRINTESERERDGTT